MISKTIGLIGVYTTFSDTPLCYTGQLSDVFFLLFVPEAAQRFFVRCVNMCQPGPPWSATECDRHCSDGPVISVHHEMAGVIGI